MGQIHSETRDRKNGWKEVETEYCGGDRRKIEGRRKRDFKKKSEKSSANGEQLWVAIVSW